MKPDAFSSNSLAGFVFFFFLRQVLLHSKIERKVQRFPLHPLPHTCIVSPIISICCQSDAFMTIVETPLTQYNQLLSTVYTMARPWCGASRVWTNP